MHLLLNCSPYLFIVLMTSKSFMEKRDYWPINQTSYNVNHFVNESINSLKQEVIKVRQTILCGLYNYLIVGMLTKIIISLTIKSNKKNISYYLTLSHSGNASKKIKSSRPKVFLGKGVLKIYSKFTGEHPCWIVLCNFIEITIRHGCYPVNLLHVFWTPFHNKTYRRLLLKNYRMIYNINS